MISEKFRAALDAEDTSEWLVTLDDENIDYIRGCRRGIEMTLRTIRDQYTGLMISVEEDGSVRIGIGLRPVHANTPPIQPATAHDVVVAPLKVVRAAINNDELLI